jgi:DNA-binding CsgD family transcriptional regulator
MTDIFSGKEFDFSEEILEIKVSSVLRDLPEEGRSILLRRILGPLLVEGILTLRESAFFFLVSAKEASEAQIARDFNCNISTVYKIVSKAEDKIKRYRKGGM